MCHTTTVLRHNALSEASYNTFSVVSLASSTITTIPLSLKKTLSTIAKPNQNG